MLLVPAMAAAATWDLPVMSDGDVMYREYWSVNGHSSQRIDGFSVNDAAWEVGDMSIVTETLLHFDLGPCRCPPMP